MAAVVRVLEDLDARQVLVEALAVPALRARSASATLARERSEAGLHAAEATPSYEEVRTPPSAA